MTTKLLEVRDRATFIPVMATRISRDDGYLARRAGFGEHPMIILTKLTDIDSEYDAYAWGNRTMTVAHNYIDAHFDDLKDGAVVDVEFILGESTSVAVSEEKQYGIS